MLSKQEKSDCSEILELLSDEDLFSLMNTTTNRVVLTRNRKEAKSAILQFTHSVEEFFKRRKINKDLLLRYIYLQSWSVPRDKDLHDIRNFVIHKWEKRRSQSSALSVQSHSAREASPLAHPVTERAAAFTQINNYNNNQYIQKNTFNYTTVNVHVSAPVVTSQNAALSLSQEYQDALNFVKWFYSLLNSCNPDMGPHRGEFGPQHFWHDAHMRLEIITKERHVTESLNGAEVVARKLLTFSVSERLIFCLSPSEDSIKIRSDKSGKKIIMACGELHSRGIGVGYFCQSFGLLADPVMNSSYKVKITLLKMNDKKNFTASLTQDKDASVMEGLTISAIQGLQ